MASQSNIVKPGFTQCSEIYYGSLPIAQVYYGGILVWEKSGSVTYSIVSPSNSAAVVSYTPTSDITVESFSQYIPTTSIGFNYVAGIWGPTGTNIAFTNNTAGLSIITDSNIITVGSTNFYKATHTYDGSGPSLTSGTTYYFFIGQTYTGTSSRLSIDGDTSRAYINAYEWQLSGSLSMSNLIPNVSLYLEVTAL